MVMVPGPCGQYASYIDDGPHTITVTATDPAGNVGTTNAVVTVDTTAPVVALNDV